MDIGSLVSSLAGLGAKVGASVPGMRKPKKVNTAKEIAKTANSQFGAAVGAAQSGHGASRGLALREGLRQGVAAAGKVSAEVGKAAQRDVQTNQANTDARNQRISTFGGDLAKGLGDMAAAQIQPKKGTSTEETEQQGIAPGTHQAGTGVSEQPLMQDDSQNLDDIEQGLEDQAQVQQEQDQQALIDDAGMRLDEFRGTRQDAGIGPGPVAAFQVDPTSKLIETMKPSVAPQIEQQLADRLHMKELALSEAERLGIGLDVAIPRLNRRFALSPGQSFENPMGQVKTDFDSSGEE